MQLIPLLGLELRKQFSTFKAACVLAVVLLILAIGKGLVSGNLSGCSWMIGLSAFLAAVILGISSGHATRNAALREQEETFPVPVLSRVLATYFAGLICLTPFMLLLSIVEWKTHTISTATNLAPEVTGGSILWMVISLLKVHLLCFFCGSWIALPVIGAFVALLISIVDTSCSLILWMGQDIYLTSGLQYGPPQHFIGARLLFDVLLLFATLSVTERLTFRFIYDRKENVLLWNVMYPVCCLAFSPVTSWLIFSNLMAPGMHEIFRFGFPSTVLFNIAHFFGLV